MAKKATKNAKATKPVEKKRAPARTPKPRRASERRTRPQKAPRRKTGARPGQTSARAETPLAIAPDPVLHTQVDRDVMPVTDSPAVEHASVANRQAVPYGTVRT